MVVALVARHFVELCYENRYWREYADFKFSLSYWLHLGADRTTTLIRQLSSCTSVYRPS